MATNTNIQISKQDPAIQEYRENLLADVEQFIANQIALGPSAGTDYKVADLTAPEYGAVTMANQGLGAYLPFLQAGERAIASGQAGLQGIGAFNPFENQVVSQTLADIGRQGAIERNRLNSQAVGAGAFGGSRQAVAEQELNRNVLEQMGRTAGDLRSAGYDAMMGRRLAGAELMGKLGMQQAGIGELAQNLTSSQIQNALTAGGVARGVDQSVLDAMRLTNEARMSYPYQQYGFLSDIYAGIPTSQSVITSGAAPQVSPFQTALGLGIGAFGSLAGAQQAGIL
jgi:hypothetical protein